MADGEERAPLLRNVISEPPPIYSSQGNNRDIPCKIFRILGIQNNSFVSCHTWFVLKRKFIHLCIHFIKPVLYYNDNTNVRMVDIRRILCFNWISQSKSIGLHLLKQFNDINIFIA